MKSHHNFAILFLQLSWTARAMGVRVVFGFPQATSQFELWYEQYGFVFSKVLRVNCQTEYHNYRYGVGTRVDAMWHDADEPKVDYKDGSNVTIDYEGGGDEPSSITQPVILCILNHTSDYIKSAMGSAQVLLGLTPTILALLGPSHAELSLLTVVAQRPVLALILALACPSVYLNRAFDNASPLDTLKSRPGTLRQWRPEGWRRRMLIFVQYLLAIVSLGNIAVLYYQLGVQTVCMIWPNGTIAPLVWGILVLPIHATATIIFRLQVRRLYRKDFRRRQQLNQRGHGSLYRWMKGTRRRIRGLRKIEAVPAALQKGIYVVVSPDTKLLIGLKWLLTPGIIVHIIFGTLTLSSLTFIGPRDALEVVGRFLASVLFCRAILVYEIAGIRDQYTSPGGGGLVPVLPLAVETDNSTGRSGEEQTSDNVLGTPGHARVRSDDQRRSRQRSTLPVTTTVAISSLR